MVEKTIPPSPLCLTVVHDGCRDILAGYALIPGSLDIQIESHFAAILARVEQVPLELEVGIRGHIRGVDHGARGRSLLVVAVAIG